MAQLPPDSHCASWSQTPEPVLAGAAAGAGAGASYSAASASSLSDEDEEDELEGAALVAGPVRSRSMTWPTKIRSGFSMPLPAATAAQLSGASFESVSPGWTTCGRCVGAAPLTSAKPTTPMEATAAATAARFMVRLSNSFPSVGVRVSRSTDRGPVSRGSPPHSVAPFRAPQRAPEHRYCRRLGPLGRGERWDDPAAWPPHQGCADGVRRTPKRIPAPRVTSGRYSCFAAPSPSRGPVRGGVPLPRPEAWKV